MRLWVYFLLCYSTSRVQHHGEHHVLLCSVQLQAQDPQQLLGLQSMMCVDTQVGVSTHVHANEHWETNVQRFKNHMEAHGKVNAQPEKGFIKDTSRQKWGTLCISTHLGVYLHIQWLFICITWENVSHSVRLLVPASYLLLCLAVNCEEANCFPSNSTADTFVYSAKKRAEDTRRAETLRFTSIEDRLVPATMTVSMWKGFLWQTFWFGGQSSTVLQETHRNRRVNRNRTSDCKHEHTKALTVCGAEVSETPSGLFPAWGTRTDPLKHICIVSDKQRKQERWKKCSWQHGPR